ncbi:hypothetical protein C8R44DRAFT_872559 [Mycena epipterygia]|nr:hypothetical protein C8R44DRAFT_872559 [Mycena epipterygia]
MPQRLTNREMLSYGFKPGEPWAEQRRELERALDRPDRGGMSHRSMSGGLGPSGLQTQAVQRQHSTNPAGYGYVRQSGHASPHLPRADYPSPGRNAYPQDPWMQYRDSSLRPVSSRALPPLPSYASGMYERSYSHGYAPSSSYTPPAYQLSRSVLSRYSGYGHSGSESSRSYTPRSVYDSDDEDYTHTHGPSSGAESELHFSSGYAETTFIVEPSDSGSEEAYSGGHSSYDDSESGDSSSGYSLSGSEGDSVYSEGADDEYEDSYDDGGSFSDDGGYYSD